MDSVDFGLVIRKKGTVFCSPFLIGIVKFVPA